LGFRIVLIDVQDITGGSLIQSSFETELGGYPAAHLSIFGFDHEIVAIVTERDGSL